MAKKSKIVRNQRRLAIVEKHAARRESLKADSVNPHLTRRERDAAAAALQRLPRDASPTRLRNRGISDGRARGYLRKFGLSRIQFRDLALKGDLPGVTKSSW